MQFRTSYKGLASAISFLAISSCGSQVSAPQASGPLSLTGFPQGTVWPCEGYYHALKAEQRECLRIPSTGSELHPAIDVLIELRDFSPSQTVKVKEAIYEFGLHWEAMRAESSSPNDSSFARCLDANVNNRMWPTVSSFPEEHRNKRAAIFWAVLNIQYIFEYHARNKIPLVIAGTSREGIMGEAYSGSDGENTANGDLRLAYSPLDDARYTSLMFAGTLMHEWFHRKGYDHPDTGYEDTEYLASLTVAAGSCVRSRNVPGIMLTGPALLDE